MLTRAFAFLALVTIGRSNDVIVGLKTDGTKFFDENRQANPALWRQMDNVTIKAPENEVIKRVVITDLRPEKDGDVKIVEGGEGQKNVTIELKSPTVFKGYEFHIEVFSSPEGPFDQQSTTEDVQHDQKTTAQGSSDNPGMNLDATSKLPDFSTDKNAPAILTKDEVVNDNERQGRNAKDEDISTEGTTEITSTTLKSDQSTVPVTQNTESVTENHSEASSDPNQSEHQSTMPPIPLYKTFNIQPAIPVISGKDVNNNENNDTKDETRHVRDTQENLGKSTIVPPINIHEFVSSTENDKEVTTTEVIDEKAIETKSEGEKKEDLNAPKIHTFGNRKFTSIIPSKVENPGPIAGKEDEKLRNSRDANTNDEQIVHENLGITTESGDVTTTTDNSETSTMLNEECVTTEAGPNEQIDNAQNPLNDNEGTNSPVYINDSQWKRLNNPRVQTDDVSVSNDQKTPDLVLHNQSISADKDAETIGNDYKPTPDHMESKNPKISAIANFKEDN